MDENGNEKQSQVLSELVDVKLAVSKTCKRVFVSSRKKRAVQVFVMENDSYVLFRTVQERFPLYDIAVNPDSDLFVVNRHTSHSSAVYRWSKCKDSYEVVKEIKGDADHYAVAMTDSQIALGDRNGKVSVFEYTSPLEEEGECITFGLKSHPVITNLI
jgi:hypothetical protein